MKIFVSYRSLDRESIRNLLHELEDVGHEIWSDQSIRGGQDWWEQVLAGIRSCDLFLFGVSPHWFDSNACLSEFDYATSLGKNRLPILLSGMSVDDLPPNIRRLQVVHYVPDVPNTFRELQRAINRMPTPRPLPNELPEPPNSPLEPLAEYDQRLRKLRLERDAQSAMVFELKQALRRRQSAEHARSLLESMRKHPDTVETVAVRIDRALSETDHKRHTLTMDVLAPLPDEPTVLLRQQITPANAQTLKPGMIYHQHTDTVYAVKFSNDNMLLASASGDKTVRLYNINSEESLAMLRGHDAAVRDVAFSPESTQVASASADATVRLWGIRQNRDIHLLEASPDWVLRVAYSPTGQLLATSAIDEMTRLWDVETGAEVTAFGGHADWVSGLAFSPDGTLLATGSYDGTIRFWNVARRRRMNAIVNGGSMIEDIAFNPSGTALVAAMNDGKIRFWSVAKQTEIATLHKHSHTVYSIVFSPHGNMFASGGADGVLRLWDANTLSVCAQFETEQGTVWSVAFSADGGLIATGGEDGSVRLWGVKT